MKPASKRSTRSGVTIAVGPMSLQVNVFSGVAKPESPKSYCTGPDQDPHPHAELKSLGRQCPNCEGGTIVSAYRADDGALVPVSATAAAERLLDVTPLRDKIDLVSVSASDLASSAIDSGNIYWLVPTSSVDETNYAGLAKAIESDGLNLVAAWASRSVAKLYRLGTVDGLLTLTEMVPMTAMRAAPADPPQAEASKVDKAAQMFRMASTMEEVDRDEILALSVDPGRAALARAANRTRAAGVESLKIKRGTRTTFSQRSAEAQFAALQEVQP